MSQDGRVTGLKIKTAHGREVEAKRFEHRRR
jgi:hypothetical protein